MINKILVWSHPNHRRPSGNMLALIAAITATVVIALLLFGLKLTRIMGGYSEQRTAIEASALAAAKDLGAIVINDPNFGWIGMSDSAPSGNGTANDMVALPKGDGYDMPVIGINTLLATVRLDMVIADTLGDNIMQQRAWQDYQNALAASRSLVNQLQLAANGGTGIDVNGNILNPAADAIQAYNSNIQRMTGNKTQLVAGSMKLTLGCIQNSGSSVSMTTTPVPQPAGVGQVSANSQQNNCYLAYIDVPYKTTAGLTGDFVFSGLAQNLQLVDPLAFSTSVKGLSNKSLLIPSVVKCQAEQIFYDRDEQGNPSTRTVQIAAAAQESCNNDPRPHPGALTFSFPNGVPPEITSPLFLYNDPTHAVNYSPVDQFEIANQGGDYPEYNLQNGWSMPGITLPASVVPQHPRIIYPISSAIYDWIRRGGATVNVQSLVNWFSQTTFAATPNSVIYTSEFNSAGNINTALAPCPSILSRRVSQNQWTAIVGGGLCSSNGWYYDLIVKDLVYQPGTTLGGAHGGEPLGNQVPPSANPNGGGTSGVSVPGSTLDQAAPAGGEYPYGPGSGPRPTYNPANDPPQNIGQAVDIRFRKSGFPYPPPPTPQPVPNN